MASNKERAAKVGEEKAPEGVMEENAASVSVPTKAAADKTKKTPVAKPSSSKPSAAKKTVKIGSLKRRDTVVKIPEKAKTPEDVLALARYAPEVAGK